MEEVTYTFIINECIQMTLNSDDAVLFHAELAQDVSIIPCMVVGDIFDSC